MSRRRDLLASSVGGVDRPLELGEIRDPLGPSIWNAHGDPVALEEMQAAMVRAQAAHLQSPGARVVGFDLGDAAYRVLRSQALLHSTDPSKAWHQEAIGNAPATFMGLRFVVRDDFPPDYAEIVFSDGRRAPLVAPPDLPRTPE